MNKKAFWLSILGIIISFVGGFLLANALNRKELDNLRAEAERLKSSPQTIDETDSQATLSEDEIRQKIAEADANPENIQSQKGLAVALYQYARIKREPKWLIEIARLLNRVHQKNPRDYNTLISLGNIYFDIAQDAARIDTIDAKGDTNKNFGKAREFYLKALEINPDDTDIRTDLGLTYLLENPPDNNKAAVEFQKTLQANPKDEKALVNIIRAFINADNIKQAEEILGKLKQVNPKNEALPELETQILQNKNNKQ
jgi:tetratricopeptide (TPR) repeat protein